MNPILAILLCVVALVIGAALSGYIAFKKGVEAGIEKRKQQAESVMGSAENEAERIIQNAERDADNKKKSALVEAKDEIHKLRSEADKEIKDRKDVFSKRKKVLTEKMIISKRKTKSLTRK